MPNLNDYLKAERVNLGYGKSFNTKGNVLKHQAQDYIIKCIRKDMCGVHIEKPVKIHYHFYEPNKKRDLDNVASFTMKVVQDSLVLSKVLKNDGWEHIKGFSCQFSVDKDKPRIEITIIESEE